MEVLTGFLEGMVEPFTVYLPALATGIYTFFINTFATVTVVEGVTTVTGLNALGYIAAGLIGIGAVAGLTATVLGIMRLRKKRGARKIRRPRTV